MASFNRIILVGNLTRDPEMRQLPSGQSICRLGIATNRQFKNKQTGAVSQEVCFIDVDVWGAQAESCRQFLQKGKQVLIEGRLKYDSWQDAQGQTRNKHSIVADVIQFLNFTKSDDASAALDDNNALDISKFGDNKSGGDRDRVPFRGARKSDSEGGRKKDKNNHSFNSGEVDFADTPPFNDNLPF